MPKKTKPHRDHPSSDEPASPPRIVGGDFRGRKLLYSGDPRVRPMKDRVREAVFNLIGPSIRGTHAIDLFAGTGALGLEALSRGAASSLFVERHFPTASIIRQNVETLGVANRATILPANVLLWSRRMPELPGGPWVVFCSPPWDLFVDQANELLGLLVALIERAPPRSQFVVEADERFDFSQLPRADDWLVRSYPPAVVGILRLEP
ncbi:MAG TPA: RsmD family RNA methyltransferase [Pirellulales bacterium]|nr:RsmD family RNA methyltransferase [Pirellulales bacterium]